jgi:hypothetical protein
MVARIYNKLNTVPERRVHSISYRSRTVNGAACRGPCAKVKFFGTIAEFPATYISTV